MELDPQQLQCDNQDGRLAVAFGYYGPSTEDGWAAYCPDCLQRRIGGNLFFYVRFRPDPNHDHLKSKHDPADNHDREHRAG